MTRQDRAEEAIYSGACDEVVQIEKWKTEAAEREMPRAEASLDEFLKAFDLVPTKAAPFPVRKDDETAVVLSPVLLGHEKARERRAKLLLELEEAVPENSPPLMLPPAWSAWSD